MSRWRLAVIFLLFAAPFLFLMAMGSYTLFDRGWAFYAWWPLALSISASLFLAWYWQKRKQLMPEVKFEPIPHGSDRDVEAWNIVKERVKQADTIPPEQFSEPSFYLEKGQELALDLARYYHPGAKNPYDNLTVPEILAVTELASRDLSELVNKYVPGGHVLTISDYRRAVSAYDWYKRARNLYWLVSAVFSPVETAVRYFAAKYATGKTWDLLQQNILLWFYTAFLHRLGAHLIELHSGRLRVGVDRYRELMAQYHPSEPALAAPAPSPDGQAPLSPPAPVPEITISVFGQVKVGKSSVINGLLGEQQAITDVLPATNLITRYQLQPGGASARLVLLDTAGYGHEGPREDQIQATEQAAQQSDLMLLVMHARNPARMADVQMLDRLRDWYATRPHLRMPPIVGVLTHIDLLSPALEWEPPYNWRTATRPKEQQMRLALQAAAEQFGNRLAAIVPVCTTPGKVFGIEEELLPTLVEKLGEARAVSFLRVLRAEADAGKVRKVFEQMMRVGKEIANIVWQNVAAK